MACDVLWLWAAVFLGLRKNVNENVEFGINVLTGFGKRDIVSKQREQLSYTIEVTFLIRSHYQMLSFQI